MDRTTFASAAGTHDPIQNGHKAELVYTVCRIIIGFYVQSF